VSPSGRAWERVQLARHPQRPYSLDYISRLVPDFEELHGDRMTGDDPALIAGVGTWHGRAVMFFGQQKGRTLNDRIERRFGMMHPQGYRKAVRLARQAAKFRFPIVSLIDTPGAYPGVSGEEDGIASAIATAILEWFRVRTPVVAAVVGEGGSGGALGMAVADRVVMMENSIYSVAAPEVAAAILWRDSSRKVEAAEQLHLTAPDLLGLGLIDEIVSEPGGGAHTDFDAAARRLDEALWRHVVEVSEHEHGHLLENRRRRFLHIGHLTDHHAHPKVVPVA
jgi:acetyl-CoA carboxylase carboxyl transferase subunit alpha